jgi:hypothetical protein
MQRGVVFEYNPHRIEYRTCGNMVFDPDYRYELTGETVDPRGWPTHPESNKPRKNYETKSIRLLPNTSETT